MWRTMVRRPLYAWRVVLSLPFVSAMSQRASVLLLAEHCIDGGATFATSRPRRRGIIGGGGGSLDAKFLNSTYHVGQLLGLGPDIIPYGERALRRRLSSGWADLVVGGYVHPLKEVINRFTHHNMYFTSTNPCDVSARRRPNRIGCLTSQLGMRPRIDRIVLHRKPISAYLTGIYGLDILVSPELLCLSPHCDL